MRRLIVLSSVVGVGLLTSTAAWSQDTAELDALLGETVSTTASKSAQVSTAVPAMAVIITAEDLHRHGIRTLAEAYNYLGLGIVSEDPLSDPEVGSRGVLFTNDAGKHVLLMIDGHVTNDQRNGASFHMQDAGIPIELIDHIEIMLGPGSVLYGSNATLGVINVITKRSREYGGLRVVAEGALSPAENTGHQPVVPRLARSSLNDLGSAYRFGAGIGKSLSLLGVPAEVTGQLEYFALKGPALGWMPLGLGFGGTTRHNYYQQIPSGYVRFTAGEFRLTLHGVAARISQPYSRIQDSRRDFDDPASYTDRAYGAIDLSWNRVVSSRISVAARVYSDASSQHTQSRSSSFLECQANQPNGCIHTSRGDGQWIGTELQGTANWGTDLSLLSMLGAEGRVRRVGLETGLGDLTTGAPVAAFGQYRAIGTSAALYGQQVYNPTPSVSLNAGARWDFDDLFGHRISPRGAAAVDVWHGGTAKAIYSEAFRAPTPEELQLANPFLVLKAAPLAPEIVRSAELVLQQRVGRQRMMLGAFGSWWQDVVFRERLSQDELSAAQRAAQVDSSTLIAFQFRNVARVDNYGGNASYEGTERDGRLSYGANVTLAYARVQTAQETKLMTVAPSAYGNARVSYDLQGNRPTIGLAAHWSGRRLADNGQDAGVTMPQYAPPLLDLRLTATGRVPRIASLGYRFFVDYNVATSGPYAAGGGGRDQNLYELVPVNRVTVFFGLQYSR